MVEIKFDPKKLAKLNDPGRLESLPPDRMWEKLALENPKVLVDIGAGTGFFALPFQKKSGAKVYACDISDIMLEWMRSNLDPVDLRMIEPVKMDESSVPLEDSIADLVYMINLHHELKEPPQMLAECKRLLKPGGKLMIVDWKPIQTEKGPPLKIRAQPRQVCIQLEKAGYADVLEHQILNDHFFILATA